MKAKALVGTFNNEKALVGAFSVIIQLQTSQRFVWSSSGECTWHDVLPVTVARALGQLGAQLEAPADQLCLHVLHDQVDGHLHHHQSVTVSRSSAVIRAAEDPPVPYDNWVGVPISHLPWGQLPFSILTGDSIVDIDSVLNVKVLVVAFNLEKAVAGAVLWLWKPMDRLQL